MKIFISSTIEDLKEERKKAIETVDGLSEYKAIAMERFVSSPYKSKDVCLKQIQSSDALILILGFKYGTIEKNEGVSFTELEYNEAKDLHLPIFVFIKHNSGDKWIVEESDIERKTKLENFKSRLDSDITWTAFKTPEELSTKIIEAIRNYEYEYGIIGPRLKTFISFEEFFKPFLDETKIFNHNYSLIGRTKILNELDTFIESDKKIALLYGRGGIGKSKILYEFSKTFKEKHPKWLLEFLRNENLSQNSIKELPAEKCVIIIDDAHRLQNQDISIILNLLYKYEKRFKIIFSSRCQGINFIQLSLTLQNFDMKEVTKIPEIKELTQLEMEEFGKEILGEKNLIFLKPLLRIAKDSPLIMIIGGNFIKESKIDPEKLILNVEFQKQILDRFIDELIGKATDQKIAPELCKDILSLISILSKINIKDNLLIERVSYFLNVDQDKLIEAIGVLENTGILLRRGNLLRITPDPLSDHILYKSCIAENGVLTGYGMRVFDKFNDLYFEKILFNLSELDWRLNSDNKGVNLIDDIWAKIIKEFKESSDYYHQKKILEKLERIASFQPDKVLELIKYLLTSNNSNILEILPLLLKGVSYNIDYLPYCCELLWKLGKDDSRPTNLYPNHAVRILFDLAEYQYQYRKPIKFNYKVFESIKGIILKEPDVLDHVNSPIDILAKFLEKETISNEFEGHEFIFKAFGISYKEIKPLRDEVILLLENISKSPKPKIVLKVYEVLNRLLYPPIGAFGRKVTKNEIEQWLPEQIKALQVIDNILKNTDNPVIKIKIISDLKEHYINRKNKEIIKKIKSIIDSIPDSFDLKVARAMWQLSNLNNERNIVVKEFLDRFKKSEEIFEYLNQILYNFKNCKIQLEPQFLYLIGKNNQNLSFEICKLIISNPTEPLSEYLYTLLSCIREKDLTKALELMDCALKTKNKNIYLSLANGFWNSWSRDIANDEIYILKNLINYSDITVKKTAIESLKVFPNDKIKIAIEIALEFDFGCDESLANTLFGIFDSKYGIKFEVLNNNDLVNLLFKLINIKKVDSCLYNIDKFLGYCSFKFPEEVVDILLKRINLAEKLSNESHFDYEPLPYENFKYALKGIFTCPMYKDILIKVRDNAINTFNLNHLFGWTSNLFIWLSNNFSQESIEVLNEWIDSENSYKIKAIGFLLSKAPPMFVFSNSKFVSKLLEKSYEINIECYEHIFNILFSSAISGSYIGIAGEPYPRNIEILNKSKELLENFPKGTPIYQFYKKLSEYASKAIQEDKLEYEELSED